VAQLQQLNGISRRDRLEDSPMRNSPVGYKPTGEFRKTHGRLQNKDTLVGEGGLLPEIARV
jgi:hypothetical protein